MMAAQFEPNDEATMNRLAAMIFLEIPAASPDDDGRAEQDKVMDLLAPEVQERVLEIGWTIVEWSLREAGKEQAAKKALAG